MLLHFKNSKIKTELYDLVHYRIRIKCKKKNLNLMYFGVFVKMMIFLSVHIMYHPIFFIYIIK